MLENRHPVSENLEPLRADGVELPWIEVRGKRILLVEDQEPLRACLRMMFELDGHQVTEANNGAEALNLFAMGHYDLVITDFEMPVMKGDMLAVRLKQLAPSLPILMLTASPKARCDVENPVDALLNKPVTMAELHCALGKLLSARPDPAQPSIDPSLASPSASFAPEPQILACLQA